MAGTSNMGSPEETPPFLWILESVPVRTKTDVALEGGGICIHRNGIVMSVTHGLKLDCPAFTTTTVTARDNRGLVRFARWVEDIKYQSFGLSLFELEKRQHDEVFDVCVIPDNVILKTGARIYTFIRDSGISLALSGKVTYRFANRVMPPENELNVFPNPDINTRTIGSLVSYYECKLSDRPGFSKELKIGFSKSLSKLNISIPLIQAQGFATTTLDGQCGFPVFSKDDHKLVGLIACSTGFFQFIIPSQVLQAVFDRNLDVLGLDERVA